MARDESVFRPAPLEEIKVAVDTLRHQATGYWTGSPGWQTLTEATRLLLADAREWYGEDKMADIGLIRREA